MAKQRRKKSRVAGFDGRPLHKMSTSLWQRKHIPWKVEEPKGRPETEIDRISAERLVASYNRPSPKQIWELVSCPGGEFGANYREIVERFQMEPESRLKIVNRRVKKVGSHDEKQRWRALVTRQRVLTKVLKGDDREKFEHRIDIPKTNEGIIEALAGIKKEMEELIDKL